MLNPGNGPAQRCIVAECQRMRSWIWRLGDFVGLGACGANISAPERGTRIGPQYVVLLTLADRWGQREFIEELEQKMRRRLALQNGGRPRKLGDETR
jgi:hypothetical protein